MSLAVRFDRTRFTGGEEGVISKTIGNVWASGAIFTATIRAGRELWVGISGVRRKLAETNKSRRLGDLLKATTGKCGKTFLQRSEESSNSNVF